MVNFKSMVHFMQQKTNQVSTHVFTRSAICATKGKFGIMPISRIFVLGGILMSYAHAGGKADDYMRTSISNLFDNPSKFECDGSERSAICTIDRYELSGTDNFILRNYRYTLDYKDSRVIERVSGNIDTPSHYDLKFFMPKHFECTDFTQIYNEKHQVNEQLVCTINSDTYRLWFRLRANAHASAFTNMDSMSLLQKSTTFLHNVAQQMSVADNKEKLADTMANIKDMLHTIDVNLYGIDIAITKPKLPQKIYEYMFADMIAESDDASVHAQDRYNQIAHTIYNSGVGYIYGNAMGYVWGNDTIDLRTKESLNKLFTTLRDSAMLDSNIRTIYITIVNRTNKGFNLGRAFNKITQEAESFSKLDKEKAGQTLNLFNGDVFNRYRIEVEAARFKQHSN